MIDLSAEFKSEIQNDNRNFLPFLDITLKDGTVLNLTKSDIWENSFRVEDSTSQSGIFTIGAAVTGKLSVTLNNIYDDFSEYDFADAEVIAYLGLQLSETLEKIRIGTYTVDDPSYDGSTISLSLLDGMTKFDRPYNESTLQYPATLGEILRDACQCCNVTLLSTAFDGSDYLVSERPNDEALTFGDIVACVSQIACKWAKMDAYGRLKLDWYNMAVFDDNALNGGTFSISTTPYSDGDNADGGNFTDYTSGDSVDGGTFEDQKAFHHIYATKSFSVSTDDVVITGVRVTEEFEETEQEKKGTYLSGDEGYVIDISGNVLIQKGNCKTVADYLYGKIGGMRFRPLTVSALTDPSIEAGDVAYFTDRKGNTYKSFISNRTFTLGGTEEISCDAETPSKNSAKSFSDMTKAIVKARSEAKKKLDAYDMAVQQLTNLITQSFGIFKTEEKQEDGSVIYYLHNKPELSSSSTIWKMTADAFAVSTDGGKTWNAGMDSEGNAVLNILSAVGINFDWAHGGTLKLGGKNNIDGKLEVYDAEGNQVGYWTKDGFYANGAEIKGDIHCEGTFYMFSKEYQKEWPVLKIEFNPEDNMIYFQNLYGETIFYWSEQNGFRFSMDAVLKGIVVNGTAVFAKRQDLSGTANNSPAVIIGGTASQTHIEIDDNEIHAKKDGITAADLYLNYEGGKVVAGSGGFGSIGAATFSSTISTEGKATIKGGADIAGTVKFTGIDSSNAVSDVIVAKGTSGSWRYWKWASGLAICIHNQVNNGNFGNEAWGSLYDGPYITFSDYPFSFVEIPFAFAARTQADSTDYNGLYSWIAMNGGSRTSPPKFDLVRATTATIGHPYLTMVAIGRWK